jgi:hypothetical protein
MTRDSISTILNGMMEQLAAVEHERWSHWQRYMHGKGERRPDGSLVFPPQLVKRWDRLMATPYEELTNAERESDREQVRRYLQTIIDGLVDKK